MLYGITTVRYTTYRDVRSKFISTFRSANILNKQLLLTACMFFRPAKPSQISLLAECTSRGHKHVKLCFARADIPSVQRPHEVAVESRAEEKSSASFSRRTQIT